MENGFEAEVAVANEFTSDGCAPCGPAGLWRSMLSRPCPESLRGGDGLAVESRALNARTVPIAYIGESQYLKV